MAFFAGQLVRHRAMEKPDHRRDHRPERPRRSALRHLRHVPRPDPPDADPKPTAGTISRSPSIAPPGASFHDHPEILAARCEATYPKLSDRRNIVVIADEAHRSQYGFRAKIERKTGEISYGFAKHLRDALPNASFIGFTGTPIEKEDVNTPVVFGDYIDIYDISRAVEDGATVPIYYESRLARIQLAEDEKPTIDAEIDELTEDEATSEQERIKRKWATVEALVGADNA